jgi:hypothetical protein
MTAISRSKAKPLNILTINSFEVGSEVIKKLMWKWSRAKTTIFESLERQGGRALHYYWNKY